MYVFVSRVYTATRNKTVAHTSAGEHFNINYNCTRLRTDMGVIYIMHKSKRTAIIRDYAKNYLQEEIGTYIFYVILPLGMNFVKLCTGAKQLCS